MSDLNRQFPTVREIVHFERKLDGTMVVFDGTDYRRQDDSPNGLPLKSFDESDYRRVSRLRHHNREFGTYPWDMWQEWAIEDGISEDLAGLGRSVIREADEQGWSEDLQAECGWSDNGAEMIQFALAAPDEARERWEFLLASDGESGPGACRAELN